MIENMIVKYILLAITLLSGFLIVRSIVRETGTNLWYTTMIDFVMPAEVGRYLKNRMYEDRGYDRRISLILTEDFKEMVKPKTPVIYSEDPPDLSYLWKMPLPLPRQSFINYNVA